MQAGLPHKQPPQGAEIPPHHQSPQPAISEPGIRARVADTGKGNSGMDEYRTTQNERDNPPASAIFQLACPFVNSHCDKMTQATVAEDVSSTRVTWPHMLVPSSMFPTLSDGTLALFASPRKHNTLLLQISAPITSDEKSP